MKVGTEHLEWGRAKSHSWKCCATVQRKSQLLGKALQVKDVGTGKMLQQLKNTVRNNDFEAVVSTKPQKAMQNERWAWPANWISDMISEEDGCRFGEVHMYCANLICWENFLNEISGKDLQNYFFNRTKVGEKRSIMLPIEWFFFSCGVWTLLRVYGTSKVIPLSHTGFWVLGYLFLLRRWYWTHRLFFCHH